MIDDRFCKAGCHEVVETVGELIAMLKDLPEDLPLDRYNRVPVVFNVNSERPFFKLEDVDFL